MADISRHDDDLAGLLLEDGIGKELRYDHARGDWHYWLGFRWKKDATARSLKFVWEHTVALLDPRVNPSESKVKALQTLLDSSKKASVLTALSFRDPIAMAGDEWDTQPQLLGVRNGILDLETLELHRDPHPEWNVSRAANTEWDPEAECPNFEAFLLQIMGGDRTMVDYLIGVLGYSMFGHQAEQKFWMWVGSGNNGKGTLAKVVSYVLGEYADVPSAELYMRPKHGSPSASAPRAELVKLQGIRFTWMSEPQGGAFNDELVKAHTGDDPIQARPLYSNDFITFRPTHTIIFLTNDPPRVQDVGPSMQRRARMIRFEKDFTTQMDPGLEWRLRKEAPGILRWLATAAALYAQNGLPEPAKVTQWSAEYIEENDPTARFLAERCELDREVETQGMRLYESYVDWCQTNDEEFKSSTGFGQQLVKRFKRVKRRNGAYYIGVRLKGATQLADEAAE